MPALSEANVSAGYDRDFRPGDSRARCLFAQPSFHAAQSQAYLGSMRIMVVVLSVAASVAGAQSGEQRPRARDAGVVVGVLPTGKNNAITDVAGVKVGHTTLIRGDNVRTGVTAIVPHDGNLFQDKVPGAIVVGNGFGKLMGSTQVKELGEIETPILLTSTLNVPRVADALLEWMMALPGNENVRSINAVVGETNDGQLNDIRSRPVGRDEVFAALRGAKDGPVEEGSVGAGTGTIAFGWKGGIGTSSRVTPASLGGYTVGVLVQSNFGGILTINGAPVGRELGQYYLRSQVEPSAARPPSAAPESPDGSIIMVVATDAPIDARNLERLASRALLGMGRTGSSGSNGSGDYVIAFSTQNRVSGNERVRPVTTLSNDAMSPLFQAVIEATEEAIYNSMFKATSVVGRNGNKADALPLDRVAEVLRRYGAVKR
jgi:D-aminopeptidase